MIRLMGPDDDALKDAAFGDDDALGDTLELLHGPPPDTPKAASAIKNAQDVVRLFVEEHAQDVRAARNEYVRLAEHFNATIRDLAAQLDAAGVRSGPVCLAGDVLIVDGQKVPELPLVEPICINGQEV